MASEMDEVLKALLVAPFVIGVVAALLSLGFAAYHFFKMHLNIESGLRAGFACTFLYGYFLDRLYTPAGLYHRRRFASWLLAFLAAFFFAAGYSRLTEAIASGQ